MFSGWWTSILNLLGMGGGSTGGPANPVPRVCVVGTDRTRIAVAGTDRTRITIPATIQEC